MNDHSSHTKSALGYAVRTASNGRRRRESVDLNGEFRIAPHLEMLELQSGDIFLNSIYGNHLTICQPPPGTRALLRALRSGSFRVDSFDFATEDDASRDLSGKRVVEPLLRLIDTGIVVQQPAAPSWATHAFTDRFRPQLDWLSTFTDDHNPWPAMQKLQSATISIVGMGGVGSHLTMALAAMGVGHLRLTDGDTTEHSNLTRQVYFTHDDVHGSRYKVELMQERVEAFSPFTRVDSARQHIDGPASAELAIEGCSLLAVCADAPRFVLNRWLNKACVESQVPSLSTFVGRVGPMYVPGQSPCFNCFESLSRNELKQYDDVVEALASKAAWQYPAFVAAPMNIASVMAMEIAMKVTGLRKPISVGNVIRIAYPDTWVEPANFAEDCVCRRENSC